MEKRKNIMLAIALAIAGLMISSAVSIPAKVSINSSSVENNKANVTELDIPVQYSSMKYEEIELLRKPIFNKPVSTMKADSIFAGPGDQIHPAIARTDSGMLLASYYDKDLGNLTLKWSVDNGQTFDESSSRYSLGADYPSIKVWEGNRSFFTVVTSNHPLWGYGGITYLVDLVDPTDNETWSEYGWRWNGTYGFNNMTDADLACDSSQNSTEYGVLSCVMSKTLEDEHYSNIPFLQLADPDNFPVVYGWWRTELTNCSHTDVDIDPVKQGDKRWIYAVYDWNDEGDWKLIVWRKDFEYLFGSYTLWDIDGNGNLQYPAVAAYDNNLVILAETDENGSKDIICYYSDSGMPGLDISFVADTGDDERYPDIRPGEGNEFICTFVKENNLYASVTRDGGATWSSPRQVNENNGVIVEEYKTSDICNKAYKVLFEERHDDIDIYIDDLSNPPSIEIGGPLSGKAETEYNYTFHATDPNGDDVYYYIEWGDGSNATGWIGPKSSCENVTVSHTWDEDGTYTIKAKAKNIYGAEGPEGTLTVEIPRNRAVYHPLLLRFFERFPNLFPILRYLLGF